MESATSGTLPGTHLPRARLSGPLNPLSLPQQLPLPVQMQTRRGNQQQPPTSRLTWTYAFCALFAMGAFFVAHVLLSSYLISEDLLLERGRLTGFRNKQLHRFREGNMNAEAGGMKRILVLGSHHTGTSIVTKFILESGAFGGDDLIMLPENSLKYNEYRPAVEADKRVMSKGHGPPRIGPSWVDYGFAWEQVPSEEQQTFLKAVDRIIHDLDTGTAAVKKRAWVLKDPRMSILADQWVGRSANAICVLVVRNPVETSLRLAKNYNRGPGKSLTVSEWMEFWAQSMMAAGRACHRLKRRVVFAYHSEMVADPLSFAQKLEKDIFGEVRRFTSLKDISDLLGPDFEERSRVDNTDTSDSGPNGLLWTPTISKVYQALMKRELSAMPLPGPMRPVEREAYATIVTGNNHGFVAGAIALAASVRRFDQQRDLVAMLSVEVTDENVKNALTVAGWRTVAVSKLEEPWYEASPKCRQFTESQKIRWGRMFSKLRVYSLPYQRVLYMDTDTLVLRECDAMFSLPGDFYAERSPSHRGFNAGIMLIRPSEEVLANLIQYARDNGPMVFWRTNQVGCTEQELLNRYWNGSHGAVKLNDTRHFDYLSASFLAGADREENRERGPRIAHCLTTKCPKPWEVGLDRLVRTSPTFEQTALPAHCDRLLYLEWYRLLLSPETLEARKALVRGGESDFKTIAFPVRGLGFEQVAKEVAAVGGEGGVNFRRDWRAFFPVENLQEPSNIAADLRRKKAPMFQTP